MSGRPIVVGITAGVGLVTGFAIAVLRDGPAEPVSVGNPAVAAPPLDDPTRPDPRVAILTEALAAERGARIALAEELDRVWEEIANLQTAAAELRPKPSNSRKPRGNRGEVWFDTDALTRAGLSTADIARLRERFETAELDKLYLRDLATREGWVSTPRFRNEMAQAREQLRTDLGERDYDWMLYASGRNNRVLVEDVLQRSPAADAGLRKGDVIVRYDEELMLAPSDLRSATTRGRPGETIAIDALRGGEWLRVYVPRGPLGTRLGRTRRPPEG